MQREVTAVAISWTADRKRLLALLQDLHSDVADLYSQAIEALSQDPIPYTRLMVASHCIREMIVILPRVQLMDVPERVDASRAARDLYETWLDADLDLQEPAVASDLDVRSIPNSVYVAARVAAAAGQAAGQNSRTITALVATGKAAEFNSAAVHRVHRAIEMFRRCAHRRDYTHPEEPPPRIAQIDTELRVIEQALLTRFANRADVVRAVRERIQRANQEESET
jgi:hypothetical protein